MDRVHGSFAHPAIGAIHAPAGVTGEGTLRATPDGLEIDAFSSPTSWMSIFGGLGFLVGLVMAIVVHGFAQEHGIGVYPLGLIVFGPMFAGIAWARTMVASKPLQVTVAWANVRKPDLQGHQLTFLLKQKPKGLVYFYSGQTEGLAAILTAIRNHGLRP